MYIYIDQSRILATEYYNAIYKEANRMFNIHVHV